MRMTQNEKIRLLVDLFKEISISKTSDGMYRAVPESTQFRPRNGGNGWNRAAGVGRTAQESLVRLFDLVSNTDAKAGSSAVDVVKCDPYVDMKISWDGKKKIFTLDPFFF